MLHTKAGQILSIAFCLAATCLSGTAYGQSIEADSQQVRVPTKLEIWYSGARNAPLSTRYGMQRERSLYITGLRWVKQVSRSKSGSWEYTHDIIPTVIATKTPFYRDTTFTRRISIVDRAGVTHQVDQRIDSLIPAPQTVYGIGWAPLGIRFTTDKPKWAQASFGISGGGMYFNRKMPDPDETRFNFTLDAYAVAAIPIFKKNRLLVGYHFNHVSNANSGRSNPGMNTSMWHFGWRYSR